MPRPEDYGMLLNKDIKLHRTWFTQMTKLIGITCQYKAPLPNKEFDRYGDLKAQYPKESISVGCIFQDHPDQQQILSVDLLHPRRTSRGGDVLHLSRIHWRGNAYRGNYLGSCVRTRGNRYQSGIQAVA